MKPIIIYAASRASIPERARMWLGLKKDGANIVSSWINESGPGETADFSELWSRIASEIKSCDRLVLYVESGDFPLKGALVEVGMALAFGKEVFVVKNDVVLDERDFRPLGSWATHPAVSFCDDIRASVGL
jgi:hypothetical protein